MIVPANYLSSGCIPFSCSSFAPAIALWWCGIMSVRNALSKGVAVCRFWISEDIMLPFIMSMLVPLRANLRAEANKDGILSDGPPMAKSSAHFSPPRVKP